MEAENTEKKPAAAKGKGMMIIIMVVVAVAAAAAGFFISKQMQSPSSGHASAEKSDSGHGDEHGSSSGSSGEHGASSAQFMGLDPAFVVNLSDESGTRYMQVEVQLMSRDANAKELVELYAPILRNRLVMLFSQQKSETLMHREDKERLQAEALAEVQAAMDKETGRKVIEALYFTSFVIQ